MPVTAALDTAIIQQWIIAKQTPDTIRQQLCNNGMDDDTVAAYLKEYRKLRNAKRQFNGFICMAVGALLGFISCVLTLTNVFPALYNVFLYGLTMLAITIVFIGLYLVFE
jgi:ABC-type Co2+ transport system permease subunit